MTGYQRQIPPRIWETEEREKKRINYGSTDINCRPSINLRSSQQINYFSKLDEKIPQYSCCQKCCEVFEIGESHTCSGLETDSIVPKEIDRLLEAYDKRLQKNYLKLHLLAAIHLWTSEASLCSIIETSALRPAMDAFSSNDPAIVEQCCNDLTTCRKMAECSAAAQSPSFSSVDCLLQSCLFISSEKLAILNALPVSTLAVICQLKAVEDNSCYLAEQLKLWRQRCSNLTAFSHSVKQSDFHRESFIKRIVELKLLLPQHNRHRYTFAVTEFDEATCRNLDFQSALDLIFDRYFGN